MTHIADLPSPLEAPGTIAVVGGGIVGVEVALYGRYLGYKVDVFQAGSIGQSMLARGDEPLPMLPDRSFSPLAAAAISAQTDDRPETLPVTCGQWAESILQRICRTDLLRDRIHEDHQVTTISQVPVELVPQDSSDDRAQVPEEPADEDDDVIPPDFQLSFADLSLAPVQAEAVILATRSVDSIEFEFDLPASYLFAACGEESGDAELDLASSLKRITEIFANLGDRPDLDLYRPKRL